MAPKPNPPDRDQIVRLARALGVLGLVEALYARRRVKDAAAANDKFLAANPDMVLPDPALVQRTYGSPWLREFDSWGAQNAADIAALIDEHKPRDNPKVAEWGCGLGRIARHLTDDFDYTGFDFDPSSIDWCRDHLEGTYLLNTAKPPLPTDGASFDVVFAVSIFTHLSKSAHEAWRDEILRVLRPGGVFLFTVHGEAQAQGLNHSEKRRFDRGELVVRGGVAEGSRTYLAYHPQRFVEELMLQGYEQVGEPVQACGHTLYVGRKPGV